MSESYNINSVIGDFNYPRRTITQEPAQKETSGPDCFGGRFTVTCKSCASTDVIVENSVGYSSISGIWGEVKLVCVYCRGSVAVLEAWR
jgi:hypothetical protein